MGINSTEVSYGFGQLGSGYLNDTGALTPPTGKVIVAINVIANAKFTTLTADKTQGNDATFISTGAQADGNGANSEAIAAADEFGKGTTLYGRWLGCELASGIVVVYYGV